MGKYDRFKSVLPRAPKHEGGHADRVTRRRAELIEDHDLEGTATLGVILKLYQQARANRDVLKEELSALQVEVDALEGLVLERYEEDGIRSAKTADGGLIYTVSKPYLKVVDREAFRQWCLDQGYEREMTLAWQTANSIASDRLLKGLPEPPGTEVFMDESITYRKGGSDSEE